MNKKYINWSNISTALLVLFVVTLLVSPKSKAFLIEGLMKVGLFQPPAANSTTANNQVMQAPELLFTLPNGKTLNTGEQKGKVIILNFWATWCPPCIAEMPSINQLYLQFKNNPNVLIIPVDVDGDFGKSVTFMQKNGYALPVYNMASDIPDGFIGQSIPTTVIINKNGQVVLKHEGAADYTNKKFIAYLTELSQ
ncbi:TlpA family protein disulfide reductase [Inquilinus sp. KBS0705]|nr:TlpA family protein disulfide reductase [Inquilinus sp. KBS0705]